MELRIENGERKRLQWKCKEKKMIKWYKRKKRKKNWKEREKGLGANMEKRNVKTNIKERKKFKIILTKVKKRRKEDN